MWKSIRRHSVVTGVVLTTCFAANSPADAQELVVPNVEARDEPADHELHPPSVVSPPSLQFEGNRPSNLFRDYQPDFEGPPNNTRRPQQTIQRRMPEPQHMPDAVREAIERSRQGSERQREQVERLAMEVRELEVRREELRREIERLERERIHLNETRVHEQHVRAEREREMHAEREREMHAEREREMHAEREREMRAEHERQQQAEREQQDNERRLHSAFEALEIAGKLPSDVVLEVLTKTVGEIKHPEVRQRVRQAILRIAVESGDVDRATDQLRSLLIEP